jgi:hypothetical protein
MYAQRSPYENNLLWRENSLARRPDRNPIDSCIQLAYFQGNWSSHHKGPDCCQYLSPSTDKNYSWGFGPETVEEKYGIESRSRSKITGDVANCQHSWSESSSTESSRTEALMSKFWWLNWKNSNPVNGGMREKRRGHFCDNAYAVIKRARLMLSLCCNSYLPNLCGKWNFPREDFVWESCISANVGNFFPQKLGTIFFVTNNSKIFKNKINNVNHLTLVIFCYWVGSTFRTDY